MEPRLSLTAYTIALSGGLAALALTGLPYWASAIAAGLVAYAVALNTVYFLQRRAARGLPEAFRKRRGLRAVPKQRAELEWWVRGQWLLLALTSVLAATTGELSWTPLADRSTTFWLQSALIGWSAFWAVTYASALVDWFLILPKVSGIASLAPCESWGERRWIYITNLWTFHRGVATLFAPLVVAATFALIGVRADDGAVRIVFFVIAAIVAARFRDIEAEGVYAISWSRDATRQVGDVVTTIHEAGTEVSRRLSYTVDVASNGAKFKYLSDSGRYEGARFAQKHDNTEPMPLGSFSKRAPATGVEAPCAEKCTGVNWYCYNNPLAYSQSTSASAVREIEGPDSRDAGADSRPE